MIDFELSDELALLRDTARSFAAEELRPNDRGAESERSPSAPVRDAARRIGLAAVELPEALGGADLGALARVLVLEELAAADAGATLALDPLGPALYALAELGGEAALAELALPVLETPGARAVLAWDDEDRVRCAAGRADGELPWVPSDRVDLLVLLNREGVRVFDPADGGIDLARVRGAGLRAAGASGLSLAAAPVRHEWSDPPAAARALARARLYVAALEVGVMRASAEYATGYARGRVAFGRPIAHHQALAFLIADLHTAVDAARVLLWEAAHRFDAGAVQGDLVEAAASAFVEAAEQAQFVTPNGVQILGGHGFMQDYPVEKFMREARALSLLVGGVDAAREDAGRELAAAAPPLALTLAEQV